MLNLVVVFLFFFGIRSYYGQLSIEKAPLNQILIQCEDSYSSGSPLDVQVRLYNNSDKRREVTITDFSFQILNSQNEQIYSFRQSQPVRGVLDPFVSRLLFDLKREKEITNLPSGEYLIRVELAVDGKKVSAEKKFLSVERYELIVENLKDFYFVGERARLKVNLLNQTSRTQDLRIDAFSASLKQDGRLVWQSAVQVKPLWQNVRVGELVELADVEVPFDREGVYSIQFDCVVNGSMNSLVLPVACVSSSERNLRKVKIYTDAPKLASLKSSLEFSVYLLNDTKDNVYLEVEEIAVSLLPSSLDVRKGPTRMWLTPYSKYEIFKFYPYSAAAITQPGTYKLLVKVATKNDRLDFETTMQIGE
ncbi:hypothetical protein [Thermotoga caldifontis]|uniref:hypothetical protein n=1 Tax=Thermotoga caldifontis TaxID=1508419 RepID=UPI001184DA38|nr:hypothetical protein [Thermotoga caldifontis]